MSELSTLVSHLKSCSSTCELYKTLFNLREIVIKEHSSVVYLKDHGAVKHLIKLLSRPNGKLLNVCLSILGNCCLDNEFRRKAVKEGLISSLCLVMKSIAEDNIQCRCCRIIGNIALSSSTCDLLNENNVSCLLLSALSNAPSLSTQLTAIRAARLLFIGSRNDHRLNIVNCGIIKVSVNFLKSENTQVQKCVLRLILAATHSRSSRLVHKIYDDTGLGALIPLISSQPLVLHILHSLGHVSFAQQQLAKDGLIEALIQHLQSNYCQYNKNIRPNCNDSRLLSHTEYNISGTLISLVMFCHEPFCRSRLRHHPTAFDLLLNIISKSSVFAHKKSAIKTLSLFIHDEYALKALVEKNFVSIMIRHLQQLIAESKQMKVVMVADRRPSELQDDSNIRSKSPTAVEDTPGSSYSPVCSESDATPVIEDGIDELDAAFSSSPSSPNSSCADGFCQNTDFYNTHDNFDEQIFVLEILRPITYLAKPVFELCHKSCWETLLDCLSSVNKCSGVFQILFVLEAIARSRHFFSQLLTDSFPLAVHRKLCRRRNNARQPSELSDDFNRYGKTLLGDFGNVAECTFGRGVIMNEFRSKLNSNKLLISLIIAHVVRDIRFFGDVLFRCEFVENMLQALQCDKLFEDAVSGLHCLALTFTISDNRDKNHIVSCSKSSSFCSDIRWPLHCANGKNGENEVKFMLDDETVVTGNKMLLNNSSPVFKAMFCGSFKESKEHVVRLPEISKDCLILLMHLLVSQEYCIDCLLRQCQLDVLLESIVQCDRFLVNETADKIMAVVMNVILSYNNCHIIYKWAIQRKLLPNTDNIPNQVINYLLVNSTLSFDQRAIAFKSFLHHAHLSALFLQHIRRIFSNQLPLLR